MRIHPFLASLLLSALATLHAATPARRPNIIVFLADDFGRMDLGCYNPKTFYETPHLDRLAQQGVRFTDAYAANPVCSPTRYSIMTGKYPTRVGLTNWLAGVQSGAFHSAALTRQMALEEHTLAEALRGAGYRTAFVGKWHLGEQEKFWPEAQGFEINVGGHDKGAPASYFSPYKNPRLADGPAGEFLPDRLADETIKLFADFKARGEPFLLCHWFYSVHTPLQAPVALVEKYKAKAERLGVKPEFTTEENIYIDNPAPHRIRANQSHTTYAAMVETMDTALGKMLAALDQLGLTENTLVIFTSDNGGLASAGAAPTSNAPFRAGKGWVYEGGIREPFLVRWPGVAKAGTTSAVPIISNDIYATALEAAGAKPQPGQIVDGRSLVALLTRGEAPQRDALYWHYPHYHGSGCFPGGAIRMGDWKLVERYEDGRVQLYDLSADIGERNDLAAVPGQRQRVAQMRAKLHDWYRETNAQFLVAKPGGPQPWRPGM
jgi:arylsulfatase A-like enzyme